MNTVKSKNEIKPETLSEPMLAEALRFAMNGGPKHEVQPLMAEMFSRGIHPGMTSPRSD